MRRSLAGCLGCEAKAVFCNGWLACGDLCRSASQERLGDAQSALGHSRPQRQHLATPIWYACIDKADQEDLECNPSKVINEPKPVTMQVVRLKPAPFPKKFNIS